MPNDLDRLTARPAVAVRRQRLQPPEASRRLCRRGEFQLHQDWPAASSDRGVRNRTSRPPPSRNSHQDLGDDKFRQGACGEAGRQAAGGLAAAGHRERAGQAHREVVETRVVTDQQDAAHCLRDAVQRRHQLDRVGQIQAVHWFYQRRLVPRFQQLQRLLRPPGGRDQDNVRYQAEVAHRLPHHSRRPAPARVERTVPVGHHSVVPGGLRVPQEQELAHHKPILPRLATVVPPGHSKLTIQPRIISVFSVYSPTREVPTGSSKPSTASLPARAP